MIHHKRDRSLAPIPPDEVSTLRLNGPIRSMLGRNRIDLTKAEAASLCRWIGVEVHRPELETVPGPDPATDYLSGDRRRAESPESRPLDADATAADIQALRVGALTKGTPANSSAPPPKASRGRKGA